MNFDLEILNSKQLFGPFTKPCTPITETAFFFSFFFFFFFFFFCCCNDAISLNLLLDFMKQILEFLYEPSGKSLSVL